MKITKDVQAQARRLMRLCTGPDGRLQEGTVREVASAISARRPRNAAALLTAFTELVRLEEARHTATITSAIELTEAEQASIRARLEARHPGLSYRWELDPALIAGLTVKVGDDVTDASVRTRISRLSTLS